MSKTDLILQELKGMNGRLANLEADVSDIKVRLTNVEADVKAIKSCPTIQKELIK